MDYRDKTAVVTGAAGGIGKALCLQLARAGATVGAIDRDAVGLKLLADELGEHAARIKTVVADAGDREQVRAAVADLAAAQGPADLLFPFAGICGFELVDDLNVPQVERIMRVNFLGVVYAVEAVLPAMLAAGKGNIVAPASMTAVRAIPFEAGYGASKAALVGYLESLRPPLRRRGVYVTLAYPGFVQTALLDALMKSGMKRPPGIIDADTTARKILAAAARNYRFIAFPWYLTFAVWLGRIAPGWVYDRVMVAMAGQVKLPY